MCRPRFVEPAAGSSGPVLNLQGARHPVQAAQLGEAFVPNDTQLHAAGVDAGVLLVTGPNMGGKSTVLRQTCLAVIMAQVGCYVAAESCELTPVDRIFTRVGAQDCIMEGKSTFLVELEETSTMLARATDRSLAVLDELGRGTSTFDGTAIALAVLEHLAYETKARCLFATHYHVQADEVKNSPRIIPFHMDAAVDEAAQTVTFLYKFRRGLCPKSYGMNVARLAGLPDSVVEAAAAKSNAFEEETRTAHLLTLAQAACNATDEELRQLYASAHA